MAASRAGAGLLRARRLARATERPSRRRRVPGRLRIALLAPPWLPVPPTERTGVEEAVALLADALVARGHEVELLCAPGSRSAATVVPLLDRLHPHEMGSSVVEADHVARALAHLERARREGRPFDVVHDHSGWVALAMADRIDVPVVHTVHGPFDELASRFYAAHAHKAAIVCVSRAQAAARPEGMGVDAVIPNPVDVDARPAAAAGGDHLLWIGAAHPASGARRAIRVAQRTGRRLILAAAEPGEEDALAAAVEPHLEDGRVEHVGEVGAVRRRELLASAAALLVPRACDEPTAMLMAEAMAVGTPAIAFAEGAAPEVVEPGRSGLLVADEEQMAEAVAVAASLDPAACRDSARERFGPDRVAAQYEALYRSVAGAAHGPAQDRTVSLVA
jgi:glycosyltransferase involved in cell wall biosynthesis